MYTTKVVYHIGEMVRMLAIQAKSLQLCMVLHICRQVTQSIMKENCKLIGN